MSDDDKRAIFSVKVGSPGFFTERSGLAPSTAKRPRTVSPMTLSPSVPLTLSAPSSAHQDPTSPFYPPLPSATSGPSVYDQSYRPSPSSPYPAHLPSPHLPSPHHAHDPHLPHLLPSTQMYYPYGSSWMTGATHDLPYPHPAYSSSDHRSFSAPVLPSPRTYAAPSHDHPQEPSTSSGRTHPSPSPSLESVSGAVACVSSSSSTSTSRPQSIGHLPHEHEHAHEHAHVHGTEKSFSIGVSAPPPHKGKHKGRPGPKVRIPREAKISIAEHIIAKGVSVANVDELARITGLTRQQIKSQLVDNRQNVRKQLVEAARALQ